MKIATPGKFGRSLPGTLRFSFENDGLIQAKSAPESIASLIALSNEQ
jgi:hypothetical protein